MKHTFVIGAVSALLVAVGCAPDQLPATSSCTSIADCPLRQACDQTTKQCVAETEDRFFGKFSCTVSSKPVSRLEVSEVAGRTYNARYALSSVLCSFNVELQELRIKLADDISTEYIELKLPAGRNGRVVLGPAIWTSAESQVPFAELENEAAFRRDGSSKSGFVQLSAAIADGVNLEGYLDVTMTPPARYEQSTEARFGEACRNGIADCGTAVFEVGGARFCFGIDPRTAPSCTRACTANGDCSLGKSICNHGFCARRCTTDADCGDLGRVCVPGETAQESSGCYYPPE